MPVRSYGFAIGNLRAKETALLTRADMMQLSSAPNTDALYGLLRDKGIGSDATDIPGLLTQETEKLWKYITDNAPDMGAFAPFLLENDYHNYKAVLKSVIRGTGYEDLLILPAITDTKVLERAVKEKRFDLLPEAMKKPAAEAYDVLLSSGDSQLADCIVDAGCMKAQTEAAKASKNRIVIDSIAVTVFYGNIKAALRSVKAGKSPAFLDTVLTETGIVSKRAMIAAALDGEEAILSLMQKASSVGGSAAAEAYKKSAASFERFADDRLMATAKKCKYITSGPEPLIGYMLARKAEIRNLRIVYSGVATGMRSESIMERLREVYG